MEKKTQIVELVIDEQNEDMAIDAISLVTDPAIEIDFIYLNKAKSNLVLAKTDNEQRLLVSPALIPNKQIYRFDAETNQEYYVYFTEETVKKASYMYLKHQNNNNATIQHEENTTGVHTVESWIVQDTDMDKSKLYGFDVPVGTWFVTMKIENDEVWERIKEGELKGLSIEGYFVDKMETLGKSKKKKKKKKKYAQVGEIDGFPVFETKEEAIEVAKEMGCEGYHEHELEGVPVFMPCSNHDILDALEEIIHMESYNDYPQSATNNAKKAIKYKEENGTSCGTKVGWTRAGQLARRENITRDTIARMASI